MQVQQERELNVLVEVDIHRLVLMIILVLQSLNCPDEHEFWEPNFNVLG